MHAQGLARLASRPYVEVGAEGGYDRFAHLTNYSICKKDEAYVRNTDAAVDADQSNPDPNPDPNPNSP